MGKKAEKASTSSKRKGKPDKVPKAKKPKIDKEEEEEKEENLEESKETKEDFSSDAKTTDGKPWNFKITSWNINGIRAWLDKDGLKYVEQESPDVLCLQETKCSDDKIPDSIKKLEGYESVWLSGDQEGYSGVGMLFKEKPISITYGIGKEEHDKEGRVITAEFPDFYLVNTYVPNAGRKLVRLDYRRVWNKDFLNYLQELDKKKPVVLCGDLNVAHQEIDLANPKTNKRNAGFTQEERDDFSELLATGFVDSFRHLYPKKTGAYTFWTYMMNARAKNVGWRLDYFVLSKRFLDKLCDNVIRSKVMGSDHCPITALLAL